MDTDNSKYDPFTHDGEDQHLSGAWLVQFSNPFCIMEPRFLDCKVLLSRSTAQRSSHLRLFVISDQSSWISCPQATPFCIKTCSNLGIGTFHRCPWQQCFIITWCFPAAYGRFLTPGACRIGRTQVSANYSSYRG